MAEIITRGNNLPPVVVEQMFNAVAGKSSLAKLASARPIAFNGIREFVFTLDKEADIVAENGAKTNGGAAATPVTIIPIKFEYGTRVSDEFLYGSEEYRMDVLRTFAEGAGRQIARGFDIAAIHGLNPRTGSASAVVGDNNFADKATPITGATADAELQAAVLAVQTGGGVVNGIAMAPKFSADMAAITVNGVPQYPEFRFGANPGNFYGMAVDVNSTVSFDGATDALVGDFDAFRWGYAKDITLDVIQYGNPDNDAELGDLKGHNQVYLRCEAYIGWGILAPARFALIGAGGSASK